MIRTFQHFIAAALVLGCAAGHVTAAIVWDYSPATTGGNGQPDWSNQSLAQNFLEQIQFGGNTTLSGMDIYSISSFGTLGQSATIRLFGDDGGQPGKLIREFQEVISAVDSDGVGSVPNVTRKHVDFSVSLSLLPNTTYWIGMSGTAAELAQMGLQINPPGDGGMWQLAGDTPQYYAATIGDMAFRLEGTTVIPEPSTFIAGFLLALPFGFQGVRWLQSRKQVS
jgi:hypothetical protein